MAEDNEISILITQSNEYLIVLYKIFYGVCIAKEYIKQSIYTAKYMTDQAVLIYSRFILITSTLCTLNGKLYCNIDITSLKTFAEEVGKFNNKNVNNNTKKILQCINQYKKYSIQYGILLRDFIGEYFEHPTTMSVEDVIHNYQYIVKSAYKVFMTNNEDTSKYNICEKYIKYLQNEIDIVRAKNE